MMAPITLPIPFSGVSPVASKNCMIAPLSVVRLAQQIWQLGDVAGTLRAVFSDNIRWAVEPAVK